MINTAIPFTNVYILDGVWHYVWPTGLGAVRVVLWGGTLAETSDNEFTYAASSLYASLRDAPPIEVVLVVDDFVWDDGEALVWADSVALVFGDGIGDLALSEVNQPYRVLQWYRVPCSHYVIEFKNGAVWTFHSTLPDNVSIFMQTFTTPLLPDQTETLWRVTAVDANKRKSDAIGYRSMVVRPPNPPRGDVLSCTAGVLSVQ